MSRTSKFSCREGTFHYHLANGQGKRQVVCQQIRKKLRAACLKGKLEFKFFQASLLTEFLLYAIFLFEQLRQLKKLQATQVSLHHKLGINKEGEDEQEGIMRFE